MFSPGEFPRSLQQLLQVDDDPNDRLFAARKLRREFNDIQIHEIKGWADFEAALDQQNFDLITTDYDLRWATGLDILKTVKKRNPNCPVVTFTDSGSQEVAVEAMKARLDDYDYVLKSPKHLLVRMCLASAQAARFCSTAARATCSMNESPRC